MTTTVHHLFPYLDAERLDDAARLADQAIWWGQQVQNARAALRIPDLYSDDELRDFCATLQSRWGDATDYCQADAMIFAINKREFIARNCPRQETPAQIAMRYRPEMLAVAPGAAAGTGTITPALKAGLPAPSIRRM